jgi:hypothetical protein
MINLRFPKSVHQRQQPSEPTQISCRYIINLPLAIVSKMVAEAQRQDIVAGVSFDDSANRGLDSGLDL